MCKCRGKNAQDYIPGRAIGSGRRSCRQRACYQASASRLPSIAGAVRQQPLLSTNQRENHYYGDIAQTFIAFNRLLTHCSSGFVVLIGRVSANGLGYPRIFARDLASSQARSSLPRTWAWSLPFTASRLACIGLPTQDDPRPRRQDG